MTIATLPLSATDLPPLGRERARDAAVVSALIDRAFGPGRYAKTAERLREGNTPRLDLSVVCWSGGTLIGCVRQWPILIGEHKAIFLGPICVDPAWRSRGLGAALIEEACEADRRSGAALVLLVGDPPLFGPFGFHALPAGRIVMPGPVDAGRVLIKALTPGAADDLAGVVRRG